MKKVKLVFAVILGLVLAENGFSQVSPNFQRMDLQNKILNEKINLKPDSKIINGLQKSKPGEKSPILGGVLSGILPGAGEFYSKSYLKAGIFFAIEAGLWIAYASFQSTGNKKTDEFENFANTNWSINKYAQWLVDQQFQGYGAITDPQSSNHDELRRQVNVVEAQNFSHQLPPIGDQQYYELIGKYQNFVVGWADADPTISKDPASPNYYGRYSTPMYTSYSYDRQDANSYYDKGTTTLTLVILNHILSAADAAWTVSMFNKDLKVKTSMHLENKYSYYGKKHLIPVANVSVAF